jgi:hypothetical protein
MTLLFHVSYFLFFRVEILFGYLIVCDYNAYFLDLYFDMVSRLGKKDRCTI